MTFTPDTKLCDIFSLPEFETMRGQFIASNTDWFSGGKDHLTLQQLHQAHPTWNVEDMIFGLNRLRDIALRGSPYVYRISEISAARLIALPADQSISAPFFLLLAGGAYGAVCTLSEALPAAARLNQLGYDCYCLNYTTASPDSMVHGLMPTPLNDIAEGLTNIFSMRGKSSYWMIGFSAGGHAGALWGTGHLGADHYGLPNPETLLLAYPLISLLNLPSGPVRDYMLQGMFGTGYNHEAANLYSANLHIDGNYPPVFLTKAMDDRTVPPRDTQDMQEALLNAGIPHRFEIVPTGDHGYGLGSGTAAEGWIERAIDWTKEIRK